MGITHKLANGPITMTVATAAETEGKFGMQVLFSDLDNDVYLSESAATRGLARLNLDLDSVVGETLTFSQVKKDGKTYTNIAIGDASAAPAPAAGGAVPAAALPARVATPRAPAMSMVDIEARYAECLDIAVRVFVKKCDDHGIVVTDVGLQAATATLMIQSTK